MPLARSFAESGHEVMWATGPDGCRVVEAAGLRSVCVGLSAEEMQKQMFERSPEIATLRPDQLPGFMFPRLFGSVAASATLPELLAAARAWRPDVVVHVVGSFAAPLVAAVLGVPNVCVGFGPLVAAEYMSGASEAVAPLWAEHGLEQPPFAGCYDDLYVDIYPPSLRDGASDHIPRQLSMRPVTSAAPVLPDDPAAEDFARFAEEGNQPLVYLTFGTVFNATTGPFREAFLGLVATGFRVVVTVGPQGDPGAFGPLPPQVRVYRYVPHQLILDRCSLVVSHGGSGTFLGAFDRGLPQLCIPQAADQFANARAGANAGAGLTLMPNQSSRDTVTEAAVHLLSEPSFRTNAQRIQHELATMPSPDEVAAIIEERVSSR